MYFWTIIAANVRNRCHCLTKDFFQLLPVVLVTYIKSIIYETIGYIRARSFRMNLNGIISENSIATPVSRDMVKYNSSGIDTKKKQRSSTDG